MDKLKGTYVLKYLRYGEHNAIRFDQKQSRAGAATVNVCRS